MLDCEDLHSSGDAANAQLVQRFELALQAIGKLQAGHIPNAFFLGCLGNTNSSSYCNRCEKPPPQEELEACQAERDAYQKPLAKHFLLEMGLSPPS